MNRESLHVILSLGFLSLAVAILTAWLNPETGYEVSIYTNTPLVTWIGIGIALAIAVGSSSRPMDLSRGLVSVSDQ
ncbi:MAG: hypothetical protein U5K37_00840 [Natrialbaceae archaeon]|nr:hypothetical protein [Natrialbaceae archaeon]